VREHREHGEKGHEEQDLGRRVVDVLGDHEPGPRERRVDRETHVSRNCALTLS